MLGGVLLVAGTSIGAATLALPIATEHLGLWGSLGALSFGWLVMAWTGLQTLAVSARMPEGASFLSMAQATLGRTGKAVASLFYGVLLYALLAAYLRGLGDMTLQALPSTTWNNVAPLPWVLLVAWVLLAQPRTWDRLNRMVTLSMLVAFGVLLTLLVMHASGPPPTRPVNTTLALDFWKAMPWLITAFGYQVVIPSVCRLLGYPRSALEGEQVVDAWVRAVVWGSALPLVVYAVWTATLFCGLPNTGPESLHALHTHAQPTQWLATYLAHAWGLPWVKACVNVFVGCAIISSMVGIARSLMDFLADGLGWYPLTTRQRCVVAAMSLAPPAWFALGHLNGFLLALRYASLLVVALNLWMPAWMAWRVLGEQPDAYRPPLGRFGCGVTGLAGLLLVIGWWLQG